MNIIFVCRGNTCRSAMAKYIMRDLLNAAGLADKIRVDSAGYRTSGGTSMREGARRELQKNRIAFDKHRSKPVTIENYRQADIVIALDAGVIGKIKKKIGNEPDNKIRLFNDADGNKLSIKNPFNTHNYSKAFAEIYRGCQALLKELAQ